MLHSARRNNLCFGIIYLQRLVRLTTDVDKRPISTLYICSWQQKMKSEKLQRILHGSFELLDFCVNEYCIKSNHSDCHEISQFISCVQWGASCLGRKLLPICPTVYQQGRFTLCPKVNTNLYQLPLFTLTSTGLNRRLRPLPNHHTAP